MVNVITNLANGVSMQNDDFFTKNVVLSKQSDMIINYLVGKLQLGERGYSGALRMIVEEWGKANLPNPDSEPSMEQVI